MKLLNSKSILDCDEFEQEQHNIEIEQIINKILQMNNYECAIIFKSMDKAHIDDEEIIKTCHLHDFMEMIEYVDCKNGVDFAVDDNGVFIVIVYGQGYEYKDNRYLIETHIKVLPYNDSREFLLLFIDYDFKLSKDF